MKRARMFNKIQYPMFILLLLSLLLFLSCDNSTKPKEQCATPVLNPSGGVYTNPQSVSITCLTEGASIRYTTDGTDPTSSSILYQTPISINSQTTIKAQAFKSGWTKSQIISASYDIQVPTVETPVLNPAAGIYTTTQTVAILCATSNATIYYTTDGTDPDSTSAVYSIPIHVDTTQTIKAKAFKSGWTSSAIMTSLYTIQIVEAPVIQPTGGTYKSIQNVTLTCPTPGATIRYTTNGDDPTASSLIYTSPIAVASTGIIKAQAYKVGWGSSSITSESYVIQIVDAPVMHPAGGTYNAYQSVSITCTTPGAKIRYTIDGTEPSSTSQAYSSVISVTSTETIKAKAFKTGWGDSPTTSASYTIQVVATPVLTPGTGYYDTSQAVSITCSTPSAIIRYTLNGTTPTSSSTQYFSPITVAATTTIKAQAFRSGWTTSQIASEVYTFPTVETPIINPGGGTFTSAQTVSISCSTPGATIRYTLDGNDPTIGSDIYATALNINSNTTIKAKAFKTFMNSSNTASANFVINIPIEEDFVLVPGGTYSNGTASVTVSPFYMGKCEITQGEYNAIFENNPSVGWGVGDDYPVYYMTWYNAIQYCNRRSIQEELTPCYKYGTYGTDIDTWPAGWDSSPENHTNIICNWVANGYRLPTEAEWMWAARGADLGPLYIYSGSDAIDEVCWFMSNSPESTKPVGTKAPNGLGLFDMSGNLWEWNWDIYAPYVNEAQVNPHGPSTGIYRMARGGAFQAYAPSCEIAYRSWGLPTVCYYYVGFRVCRNVPRIK